MGGWACPDDPLPDDDANARPAPGPALDAPGVALDDDVEDGHFAWMVGELAAGRLLPPPESAIEGPTISVSLGDACDLDPALLAAVCGPDGLGGQAAFAAFGEGKAVDALRPGPVLAALTAEAVSGGAAPLTDDELIGVLQATRRLANLVSWQQTVVIAEFARRRQAQFEAAKAAGTPVGCGDGEFPGEELAMELVATGAYTSGRIDTAVELTSRLPLTLAGMADGLIDLARASAISARTRSLTDADAAYADRVLAAAAPGLRLDQLARKAEALEKKLAPDAVKARKELAKHLDQRVEVRCEESGNASLSGRELDPAEVLASKAYIDALAATLRGSGQFDGPIGRLRALVLTDLTQGRNPLDRIAASPGSATVPPDGLAPLPALVNILVPADTLLAWGTAPAQAAGWGLLDADETRALVGAASRHPRTRWCMTVVAPDGTAIAHGCASGRHLPPGNSPLRPGATPYSQSQQAAKLLGLLSRLNITLEPIARGTCDHARAEDHYVPSRKLKHLIRARNQTCSAPACNAQAQYCDLDHTLPYPDGPTDMCNLNPKCRRHHRTKQAPGWKVAQPTPDTATWTTPSGRTHTTTATSYDI